MFAITSTASAAMVQIGNYIYGTTEEFCKLDLAPDTAALTTGTQHTVTATVSSTGMALLPSATSDATFLDVINACVDGHIEALAGVGVTFAVTSGPNTGTTGSGLLDTTGKAFFSYTGVSDGTDTIEASLTLPDVCWRIEYVGGQPQAAEVPIPLACAPFLDTVPEIDSLRSTCGSEEIFAALLTECPMATLKDVATATWTSPPPPPPVVTVAATPDPAVSISKRKRCATGKFKIEPSYSNGTVKTSTLFIDSRKVSTKTNTSPFTINAKRYKAGKHNVEVVTVFTNGKAASTFTSFSRCKIRKAARKVAPKFTG